MHSTSNDSIGPPVEDWDNDILTHVTASVQWVGRRPTNNKASNLPKGTMTFFGKGDLSKSYLEERILSCIP